MVAIISGVWHVGWWKLITSVRLIQFGNNRNDHFRYFSGVHVHIRSKIWTIKLQKIIGDLFDKIWILHMNGTLIYQFFTVLRQKKILGNICLVQKVVGCGLLEGNWEKWKGAISFLLSLHPIIPCTLSFALFPAFSLQSHW